MAAKSFFILMVHSPPGAVGHVAAPELPSQEGKARSHGTCGSTRAHLVGGKVQSWGTRGSTGAHLSKEVRYGVMGHMAAPEPTSVGRWGSELRDTWWRRSSPQQGGEVWGRGTRGDVRAHLCREVWSKATTYVVAHGCTSCSSSWLRACMWGYRVFRVPTETPEVPNIISEGNSLNFLMVW
jgi:hypothetical protein